MLTLPRHLVSFLEICISGFVIVIMGNPMILPYPFVHPTLDNGFVVVVDCGFNVTFSDISAI